MMKVTEAIFRLEQIKQKYGDIEVSIECEHCGKTTHPTVVLVGPLVATLKVRKDEA